MCGEGGGKGGGKGGGNGGDDGGGGDDSGCWGALVVGKRGTTTKTNSYTIATTNTTNNATKHAIN